ncbi:hypothetical protein MTQ10_10390 [Streptomyces sp. XM83C]|uniref:hypothetical protein n=1 Tax=unclassified Streptomyces TaxID=2593676 RepID=UPI001FFBF115|nr:hypothetical protein [Streptomyces sp. XM83C]MCK1820016.1 hypothetical protein [Streptomyces sp. XM83C]
MISTRRIVAAACLAAGVAGIAAPAANAAEAGAKDGGRLNPVQVLDSLARSDIPEEHRERLPKVSQQLSSLNQVQELNRLNELHQVTDLVAPVTGLLPGIQ